MTILSSSVRYADAPSADKSTVISRVWKPSKVAFTVAAVGGDAERRNALSTLGAWLNVDGPRRLVLPDTPDRFYMAVPDGQLELNRAVDGEYGKLTFSIADPVAYGAEKTVVVPSGGEATFNVGGTYQASPVITASAVRDASTSLWGVQLDGAFHVHVRTGSASAKQVSVDCAERTCTVAGSATLPTLDSDWLSLAPGEHTLVMDEGTGAATVTFHERWL